MEEDVIGFIKDTQLEEYEKLKTQFDSSTDLHPENDSQDHRSRGIIDTLRGGIDTRGVRLIWSISTQILDEPRPSGLVSEEPIRGGSSTSLLQEEQKFLDMVVFLNGVPLVTMELKTN